ncbi:MAG: hypothetical protein IT374_14545 [Polyangiaceae bacterium]|nr:hypothetical protein [Polyangiaceae bacterium]
MTIFVGMPEEERAAPLARKLQSAIVARLSGLGYSVATEEAEADVVATLELTVTPKPSVLVVYVNGVQKVNYAVHAALTAKAERQVLSTATVDYDAEEGASSRQVDVLVQAVSGRRLQALAKARKARADKEAKAEADRRDAEDERREEAAAAQRKAREDADAAAWAAVNLAACTEPVDLSGCEALAAYLKKFPEGAHAREGKPALERGQVAQARLRDERDWTGAGVETCKAPKAAADCDGVKGYLEKHPAGKHVDEARAALASTRDTIEKLRKKEEAEEAKATQRREAEEARSAAKAAAEQKARERQECVSDCKENQCGWRMRNYETCVSVCIARVCNR